MSNSQTSNKKLIQIKPIQLERTTKNPEEESLEEINSREQKRFLQIQEEINELLQQKADLLEQTTTEINQAKEEWENTKQQYIDLAKEEGFEAGYSDGKETAVEEYKELIKKANRIVQSAIQDYHQTIENSEESIIDIALQVAQKIMKQKLTESDEVVLPIVLEAIDSLKDKSHITIYLNPNNYQYVLEHKGELAKILDRKSELSILIDENAEAGSCIIEHPFGKIDASVDTQLSQIRDLLYEITMGNKE